MKYLTASDAKKRLLELIRESDETFELECGRLVGVDQPLAKRWSATSMVGVA